MHVSSAHCASQMFCSRKYVKFPRVVSVPDLSIVDLSHNFLDGELSSRLFNLPKLECLRLLCTTVDSWVLSLEFQIMGVGVWRCFGLVTMTSLETIPSSLSRCRFLTALSLKNNRLTGSIPTFAWNNGRLTDTIPPTSLEMLENLSTLSLLNNLFTGGIPKELGKKFALGGPIPRVLSNLTTLNYIDLGYCNLTETNLCTNNLNIKHLLLRYNNLTGQAATPWSFIPSLEFHYNSFIDGIPDGIGGCSSLNKYFVIKQPIQKINSSKYWQSF